MSCPSCGKQSLNNSTSYYRDPVSIVEASTSNTIENVINNTLVSIDELKYTVDKLDLKMETLDKENVAMTEVMCQNAYELAMEDTKRDIKDVYYGLNWFQKLLWRILGLNRLWLNEK